MTALTPRQTRAARYLALGMSQRAAARRLGMDERTLRRWLTDVEGFAAFVEAQRSVVKDEDADDVLKDLLHSSDERVRLAAARELRRMPVTPSGATDDEDDDVFDGWDE